MRSTRPLWAGFVVKIKGPRPKPLPPPPPQPAGTRYQINPSHQEGVAQSGCTIAIDIRNYAIPSTSAVLHTFYGRSSSPATLTNVRKRLLDSCKIHEASQTMLIADSEAITKKIREHVQESPAASLLAMMLLYLPSLVLGSIVLWYDGGKIFEIAEAPEAQAQSETSGEQELGLSPFDAHPEKAVSFKSPTASITAIDQCDTVAGESTFNQTSAARQRDASNSFRAIHPDENSCQHHSPYPPAYRVISGPSFRELSVPEFCIQAIDLSMTHQRSHHFLL